MKQFVDFIPLILFFVVYKMDERLVELGSWQYTLGGVFSATEILVAASIMVYGGIFLINRRLDRSQVITLGAVILFCSFTLLMRDEAILKWKAPVVNWIFAVIFLGSQYIGSAPLIKRMMGHAIELPDPVWTKLNISWVAFFLLIGFANLFVAFTFHEYWVDFKVFGSLGLTIVFLIGQTIFLAKYLNTDKDGVAEKVATETKDS